MSKHHALKPAGEAPAPLDRSMSLSETKRLIDAYAKKKGMRGNFNRRWSKPK